MGRILMIVAAWAGFAAPPLAQGIDWSLATRKPGEPGQVYRSVAPSQTAPATTTCFIKGERESGQNKMCFYDCLGSDYAVNIASYGTCSPQVQR